jgi:hypothetical protein
MPTKQRQVFAVFGARNPQEVDTAVQREFAESSYQIFPGQWLVVADTTLPATVYKRLAKTDQKRDQMVCIVVPMSGYYGWQDKAIWDWIEANKGGD